MKGHMVTYCRRSNPDHVLGTPQEVSNSPKISYPPSKVKGSKPGKDKLAELKDHNKPTEAAMEDANVMKLSTAEVAHHIHDRKTNIWLPRKVTLQPLFRSGQGIGGRQLLLVYTRAR